MMLCDLHYKLSLFLLSFLLGFILISRHIFARLALSVILLFLAKRY